MLPWHDCQLAQLQAGDLATAELLAQYVCTCSCDGSGTLHDARALQVLRA